MPQTPRRNTDSEPRLRIGELSRRTGVRTDTLRAWERRYGLLEPSRSEGGFRLYGRDDERRVRRMTELIGSGTSPAEAARLVLAAPAASAQAPSTDGAAAGTGELAGRLRDALSRFDEAEANAVLDQALATLSLEAVAGRVVLPALEKLGEAWERGEVSVAQEHFATNIVRGRLAGLARNWGAGAGPLALLACPPGELHDIGLLVFGLVLRAQGWRITYLGTNTPIETLADAIEQLEPRAVVIAALTEAPFRSAVGALAPLAADGAVWLAGAGASAEVAELTGLPRLEGEPVEAARRLATST